MSHTALIYRRSARLSSPASALLAV